MTRLGHNHALDEAHVKYLRRSTIEHRKARSVQGRMSFAPVGFRKVDQAPCYCVPIHRARVQAEWWSGEPPSAEDILAELAADSVWPLCVRADLDKPRFGSVEGDEL